MSPASYKCPRCHGALSDRIVHTYYLFVCEKTYLEGMWRIQHAEEAGKAASERLGRVVSIIPSTPHARKFANCLFCERCELVVLAADGVIPAAEIPALASEVVDVASPDNSKSDGEK